MKVMGSWTESFKKQCLRKNVKSSVKQNFLLLKKIKKNYKRREIYVQQNKLFANKKKNRALNKHTCV